MEDQPVEEQAVAEATAANQPQEVQQLWWMASVDIVYRTGGLERSRGVNVLFTTATDYINEATIGNINVAAQKQALQLKKIPEKAVIVDAVIRGFSMLGIMTASQFRKQEQPANGN